MHIRLLIDVARNGVLKANFVNLAIRALNKVEPINFTSSSIDHFADDYSTTIRIVLAKYREMLADPEIRRRVFDKANR